MQVQSRLEPRDDVESNLQSKAFSQADRESHQYLRAGVRFVVAALAVIVLGSLLVVLGGANPWDAVIALVAGSFGSIRSFGETLIRFAPLVVIACGLAPSLRAGLFNIGALGQMSMGALGATLVSLNLEGLPGPAIIALAIAGSIIGGTVWAAVPALLRAYLRINEILTTFVFNFIAIFLLEYLLSGPLAAKKAYIAQSEVLPAHALLPVLLPDTRAHIGIAIALLAVLALAVFARSSQGYRVRLYGGNAQLAMRAGVNEPRLVAALLLIGGAAAGLAGWMQVAGVDERLYPTVAAVVGFNGLFVALLGSMNALGILFAGFLFAALLKGGESLQVASNVSPELINAIVGFIVLVFVAQRMLVRKQAETRGTR